MTSLAAFALTVRTSPIANPYDPKTTRCCPEGSGGDDGPATVTIGPTSSAIVTPGTAVLSASRKLDVCIAAATISSLTNTLDATETWTAPILGFTVTVTSSALRFGIWEVTALINCATLALALDPNMGGSKNDALMTR